MALDIMSSIVELLINFEDYDQAQLLAHVILEHSATIAVTKERVKKQLTKLKVSPAKIKDIPDFDFVLNDLLNNPIKSQKD